MKNLNLLFNKLYFKGIQLNGGKILGESITNNNKELINTTLSLHDCVKCPFSCPECENAPKESGIKKCSSIGGFCFPLKTTYPGLIIGIGNPHNGSEDDGVFENGFSFDYTTGQPYIPGSSVKGVLRGYFRNQPDAVAAVIHSISKKTFDRNGIKALELDIFEGDDVFLDCFICAPDKQGKILGGDYITPHGDDPTKNPKPNHILKVIPEVKFRFGFILKDGADVTAEEKCKLFKSMLILFGIGSKTNVGYGGLTETDWNWNVNPATSNNSGNVNQNGNTNNNQNNTQKKQQNNNQNNAQKKQQNNKYGNNQGKKSWNNPGYGGKKH